MKNSITVIGKNSVLYNSIKNELKKNYDNIIEYSHKDIWNLKSIENPLVFSFSKKSLSENIKLLKFIISIKKGRLIYISTTATFSINYTSFYKYPFIKKEIENFLIKNQNVFVVRVGVVVELTDLNQFNGIIKVSSLKLITECIVQTFKKHRVNFINHAWIEKKIKSSNLIYRFFYAIELILFNFLGKFFFITRPLDIVFRFLKFKNYGYSFLSNRHLVKKYDNIVVGSGMSSLGVISALKECDPNLKNTIVIHDFSSKLKHKSNERIIEYVGNGGNSNYWHSVISIFLNKKKINELRSIFLKKFFKHDHKPLKNGFSFIPLKPLRPLKALSILISNKQILNDELIFIEVDASEKLILHTKKGLYQTNRAFLCTGSISSLNLLYKSRLIKNHKVILSDHLVGYFGQVSFNRKISIDKSILERNGHFKKFHNIRTNTNRSMYVTLRPALFSFKSLEKASSYRDFFGKETSSIIKNLIKKFNIALILEALYNKFGLKFFNSNVFNIAGNIESKNSIIIKLSKDKLPEVRYMEKIIKFDQNELDTINNYIYTNYNFCSSKIPVSVKVSPGLHFLNAVSDDLKPINFSVLHKFNLYPFGTYLFNNNAPTHPTFDLFLDSYLQTKKLFK